MKSLTDFRKTVETSVDPRLTRYVSYCSSTCTRKGEEGEGGAGVLPIMANMGRFCLKGIPFSVFKYRNGLGDFAC